MTPFFACFFGLMLSDAAYGIVLGIVTGILAYLLRGKGSIGAIASVLCVSSVATVIWGGLLGSWFGIEGIQPWIGFAPMSDPLKMMVLCLGLGPVPHCGGTVRGHVHELQAEKALGRAV